MTRIKPIYLRGILEPIQDREERKRLEQAIIQQSGSLNRPSPNRRTAEDGKPKVGSRKQAEIWTKRLLIKLRKVESEQAATIAALQADFKQSAMRRASDHFPRGETLSRWPFYPHIFNPLAPQNLEGGTALRRKAKRMLKEKKREQRQQQYR